MNLVFGWLKLNTSLDGTLLSEAPPYPYRGLAPRDAGLVKGVCIAGRLDILWWDVGGDSYMCQTALMPSPTLFA